MAVLVMTCPHCGAENMTFNVLKGVLHTDTSFSSIVALCANCNEPVLAKFTGKNPFNSGDMLPSMSGNLLTNAWIRDFVIWPPQPTIEAPMAVPDRTARAYVEAVKARRAQLWNAACSSYRRCLEMTLKDFAPDVGARTSLVNRIDRLAADHRITPALQSWAHDLRIDGNEAVHGDDEATQEMTDQMHNLTYFLLTYLYTLPKQIDDARARRDAAAPATAPAP